MTNYIPHTLSIRHLAVHRVFSWVDAAKQCEWLSTSSNRLCWIVLWFQRRRCLYIFPIVYEWEYWRQRVSSVCISLTFVECTTSAVNLTLTSKTPWVDIPSCSHEFQDSHKTVFSAASCDMSICNAAKYWCDIERKFFLNITFYWHHFELGNLFRVLVVYLSTSPQYDLGPSGYWAWRWSSPQWCYWISRWRIYDAQSLISLFDAASLCFHILLILDVYSPPPSDQCNFHS